MRSEHGPITETNELFRINVDSTRNNTDSNRIQLVSEYLLNVATTDCGLLPTHYHCGAIARSYSNNFPRFVPKIELKKSIHPPTETNRYLLLIINQIQTPRQNQTDNFPRFAQQ